MKLVWKLLRQHINAAQFIGFFFANLFGMSIVLLGFQFYLDVLPVFTAEDSFMKADYLIVSKKIGTAATLSGRSHDFANAEISELDKQSFVSKTGQFTRAEYKLDASMGINGTKIFSSELFIESVPDGFVDVSLKDWSYKPGDKEIPIILPRSYITMYNFGFAQSHSLPKISDGLVGMIDFEMSIRGNGHQDEYRGRVIGFSSRLNTILVPQTFMDWSNRHYAPNEKSTPSRLLVEVKNPANERIAQYIEKKGYEVENDQLQTEKTTYFLRMTVSLVMLIGLVISILSFYILMLSIYLLVQKNSSKLENLLLIGYSPGKVAFPYQLLTMGLNTVVLLMAWTILHAIRSYYMGVIETLFPQIDEQPMWHAIWLGLMLFFFVTIVNVLTIRRKVARIWNRKD